MQLKTLLLQNAVVKQYILSPNQRAIIEMEYLYNYVAIFRYCLVAYVSKVEQLFNFFTFCFLGIFGITIKQTRSN